MKKILIILLNILFIINAYNFYIYEVKEYTLNEQFIGDYTPPNQNIKSCENCLWLAVTDQEGFKQGLYFSGEHELKPDLKPGDKLKIYWKKTPQGLWIKGVEKVKPRGARWVYF